MNQKDIHQYFNRPEIRQKLVERTSRLVAINSERGVAMRNMPYGAGPAKALAEGLAMAADMGFATENYENYVGGVDLNDKETVLHILGHLDVVGAGAGWTVTEPYVAKEVGGMLYGRGTADDKGPVVAALMAMECVKELGIPLSKNVKLLMGTDEESGSSDIAYYFANHPYAPYTFSPDGAFPVVNTEKGRYAPQFTKGWERVDVTPRVAQFQGGTRVNVVPSEATSLVVGMDEEAIAPYCQRASEKTAVTYTLTTTLQGVHIHAKGVGGHASMPEDGNNAITALLVLLASLPLAKTASQAVIQVLATNFPHGDFGGYGVGINQEDDLSGALTAVLSLLTITEDGVEGTVDCRLPVCATPQSTKGVVEVALGKCGFQVEGSFVESHHTPEDSPFVKTLLACYEQYTGHKGDCLAMGGGTYVHNIPGGVAFGAGMPEFQPNMHGGDEHMSIDDTLTACKIFTQVILDLCK